MERTVIERLQRTLDGRVTTPKDAGYDADRTTFNAMIQRRPVAIVRVRSEDYVIATIRGANDSGLPIAVRGGGHSVAGHSVADATLVVDLRDQRTVTVDPKTWNARVAGGAQWDDVDAPAWRHRLRRHGRHLRRYWGGRLDAWGRFGWLLGTQGLTCDNLVRAEVVTAAGDRAVVRPRSSGRISA